MTGDWQYMEIMSSRRMREGSYERNRLVYWAVIVGVDHWIWADWVGVGGVEWMRGVARH